MKTEAERALEQEVARLRSALSQPRLPEPHGKCTAMTNWGYQCTRFGRHERDGTWYCAIHAGLRSGRGATTDWRLRILRAADGDRPRVVLNKREISEAAAWLRRAEEAG